MIKNSNPEKSSKNRLYDKLSGIKRGTNTSPRSQPFIILGSHPSDRDQALAIGFEGISGKSKPSITTDPLYVRALQDEALEALATLFLPAIGGFGLRTRASLSLPHAAVAMGRMHSRG